MNAPESDAIAAAIPADAAAAGAAGGRPQLVAGDSAVRRWPLLALLLPLLPLLVLMVSVLTPRQQELLMLDDDVAVQSRPFRLEAGWFGSPRLELRAELPANSAMAIAVDLLDAAGQPVLQLTKEGWREIGTWQEDGESGTYDEQDADLVLALRPPVSGDYRLQVVREELEAPIGAPLNEPLRVWFSVSNHNVDRGLLLITAVCAAVLARLFWGAVYGDCRQRRRLRGDEGSLAVRLDLGGAGLVRLELRARYEEPHQSPPGRGAPPATVPVQISLHDALGRPLLQESQTLPLRRFSGSEEEWWMLSTRLLLQLEQPTNVRVRVALPPELARGGLELEWQELLLEDGVVTPWPVAARRLEPAR